MTQEVIAPSSFNSPPVHRHRLIERWPVLVSTVVIVCLVVAAVWLLRSRSKAPSQPPESATTYDLTISRDEQTANATNAKQALKQYLAGKPPVADQQLATTQLADFYLSQKQYAEAISEYQKAAAVESGNNLSIDQGLATAYDDSGQKSEAIMYYEKAIAALNPKDISAAGEKIAYTERIAELQQ